MGHGLRTPPPPHPPTRRSYLLLEFPCLQTARRIAEVGCGCGSALLPVLAANPAATALACDISPTALRLLRQAAERAGVDQGRIETLVLDASGAPPAPLASAAGAGSRAGSPLAGAAADAALLIFTLSALRPADMPAALAHTAAALRPGGLLCVRDYGLYDMAQLRFPGQQVWCAGPAPPSGVGSDGSGHAGSNK